MILRATLRWDKDIVVLMLLAAAAMAGNGLIVPVMPDYGRMFSDSALWVGMLITIFGVARMLSNLPTGLATRHISARSLMVAGHVALTLGAVIAALASDLTTLLIGRALQGAGSGIFLTTASACIALKSPPDRRGRMMALYQSAVFAGAGIGPMIGGYLAAAGGLRAPFWAYGVVSLLGAFLVLRISIRLPQAAGAPRASLWRRPAPLVQANLFMAFANGFSRTAALWYSIPLVATASYGMGVEMIGLAASVTALANLAILPLSGWAVDRFGSHLLPPVSGALFALGLVMIGYGGSEALFWLGATLAGIAGGLNGPSIASALTAITPAEDLGPQFGLQRTISDLGFVLGPLMIGFLADHLGFSAVAGLNVTTGLMLLSALFWIAIYRKGAPPRA